MTACLVLDVGGTRTRLALAYPQGDRATLTAVEVIATPETSLHGTIQTYLARHGNLAVSGVAIAAAGRVRQQSGRTWVTLTNRALTIDRDALQRLLDVPHVWLVNDLAAVAAALPWLAPEALLSVGKTCGVSDGHRLVVGIGTGFGAATLTTQGTLLATEAGHCTLATGSPAERGWLDAMTPPAPCPLEYVLSGPGLLRLYRAVAQQPPASHEVLLDRWAHGEPDAVRTLLAFSTWLGRAAGDLVLCHGAWGGVALCGGVVERLGPTLDGDAFRQGFEDKATFASDLAAVPVWTIRHAQPALLGLAQRMFFDATTPDRHRPGHQE